MFLILSVQIFLYEIILQKHWSTPYALFGYLQKCISCKYKQIFRILYYINIKWISCKKKKKCIKYFWKVHFCLLLLPCFSSEWRVAICKSISNLSLNLLTLMDGGGGGDHLIMGHPLKWKQGPKLLDWRGWARFGCVPCWVVGQNSNMCQVGAGCSLLSTVWFVVICPRQHFKGYLGKRFATSPWTQDSPMGK